MRFGMRMLAGCVMTSSACLSQMCVRPDLVDWLRAVLVVQPNPSSRMESAAAIYRICRHYRLEEVALTTPEAVASYAAALGTADQQLKVAADSPVNVDVCDFFLAIIFADFKSVRASSLSRACMPAWWLCSWHFVPHASFTTSSLVASLAGLLHVSFAVGAVFRLAQRHRELARRVFCTRPAESTSPPHFRPRGWNATDL